MSFDDKFDQRRLAGGIQAVDKCTFKPVFGVISEGSCTIKGIDVPRGRFCNGGPKFRANAYPFATTNKVFGLL
jgi:hypothetical protein